MGTWNPDSVDPYPLHPELEVLEVRRVSLKESEYLSRHGTEIDEVLAASFPRLRYDERDGA